MSFCLFVFKLLEMSAEKRTPKSSLHCLTQLFMDLCCFGCLCLERLAGHPVVTNNAGGIKCQILGKTHACVCIFKWLKSYF